MKAKETVDINISSFLLNCKENSELTTLADPKNINQKNAATPVNNNASTPATKMVNKMFILSSFGSSRLALRIHMNNDTKEMINITDTRIRYKNQKNSPTHVNNNQSSPATKLVNKMFILSSFGSSRLALRIHMNNDTKEMINITETSITNNMI